MEPKVNRELLGLKIHPLGKKLNYSFLLALLAPHPLTSTHGFANTFGGSWKRLLEIHPPGKKLNYSFLLAFLAPHPSHFDSCFC